MTSQIWHVFVIYFVLSYLLGIARLSIMNWAAQFEKYTKRERWSWAELERRTGIKASMISKYASGDTVPSIEKAITLARAMDVGLDELFLGNLPQSRIDDLVQKVAALTREEDLARLKAKASGKSPGA